MDRPGPGYRARSGPGPVPELPGPAHRRRAVRAWGEKVGPPSLRRPPPEKKGPADPAAADLPIGAGLIVVVVLVAVALVLLSGGDDKPRIPGPVAVADREYADDVVHAAGERDPGRASASPSYRCRAGACWRRRPGQAGRHLRAERRAAGVLLGPAEAERDRARRTCSAIVEGETENEIAQLGNVRNLPCPKDVLEECVAITYTSTAKDKTGRT